MSAGQDWDGYTPRTVTKDAKPVSSEFAALWPPDTPGIDAGRPGHETRPKTTVVYDDKTPPGKKKKRKAKPVPDGGK